MPDKFNVIFQGDDKVKYNIISLATSRRLRFLADATARATLVFIAGCGNTMMSGYGYGANATSSPKEVFKSGIIQFEQTTLTRYGFVVDRLQCSVVGSHVTLASGKIVDDAGDRSLIEAYQARDGLHISGWNKVRNRNKAPDTATVVDLNSSRPISNQLATDALSVYRKCDLALSGLGDDHGKLIAPEASFPGHDYSGSEIAKRLRTLLHPGLQ